MSTVSAIAIYFIIWWTVLFAVLPFGVRNAHEAGESIGDGNDAGAPVRHGMAWKACLTTVIAAVILAGVYGLMANGIFEQLNLPFVETAPKI